MWRRWLVVIVATAAVLAAAFWAELQYQPGISGGHQEQHHPSYAISNSSPKSIFPAELFVWIDDVVGWTDTHHHFVLAVANVFLAAFTLALFAATFGLLRFAKRQASDMESLLTAAHDTAAASASQVRAIEAQERVMREQAKTMAANLELTKESAAAAQASADAAKKAADVAEGTRDMMRDTAVRQLRAYLLAHPQTLPELSTDDPFFFRVHIINAGHTPAYKASGCIMMAILNSPSEEDFFAVAAEPHGIINPGRQFELISQFDDPFSDQEVALIRAGNPAMLYIWGEVKYVDAFDNPRYLKFRFRYGGTESIRYRRIALCERAMMQANAAHMREGARHAPLSTSSLPTQ